MRTVIAPLSQHAGLSPRLVPDHQRTNPAVNLIAAVNRKSLPEIRQLNIAEPIDIIQRLFRPRDEPIQIIRAPPFVDFHVFMELPADETGRCPLIDGDIFAKYRRRTAFAGGKMIALG